MRLLLTAAIPALMLAPLSQARTWWTTLGSARVLPGRTSETIIARSQSRHSEVRLCVDHGQLWVSDMRIDFTRGPQRRVHVARTLSHGRCSFPVRLGRDQTMRSVRFSYGRIARGARPWVRVQAR